MTTRLKRLLATLLVLSQGAQLAYSVGPAAASSNVDQAVEEGLKLNKQFKYKAAEPFFDQALKSDPKNVPALLGLSKVYRHQGKAKQSYTLINLAIKLEPNNGLCYLESAKLYHTMHSYKKAVNSAKKAVALVPNNAEAYYYLGWSQNLADDKDAVKNLRKAVQLDPKNASAWRILAYALWQQERLGEAKQCMQNAINLAPKNVQFRTELADILLSENKLKEATAVYNQMKKDFPRGAEAYLGLSEVAARQGHTKERGDLIRQATVIRPTSEQAWLKLAQFHLDERNFDEAVRCARIAVGFKPNNALNNRALAIALMNADKPQEAEKYLEKGVAFAKGLQERLCAQDLLVRLHFINNKNDRAMEMAKEQYRLLPDEYYAISAYAWALMCFKQYDEGFAVLKKGKKLFPEAFDLDKDYLGGLVSAGRYDQAKAQAKLMLTKKPNDSYIWICLMEIAKKTNNKKDAEIAMKHTNGLKLGSYDAMEMGFGGMSVGASDSSLPSLKQAIENNPASVDLIMNTRDPKAEQKTSSKKVQAK